MGYRGYEEKAYEAIKFVNKRRPALNQTNLNAMSDAIDELDDRVLELDKGIQWVFDGAISNLQYLPASNQLLYQKGNGSDFTYIDLPTPVIHGQIDSGIASDSLAQYDISAYDTALTVFNKLPQISFTMINSNAQGNEYAYSLPNANAKGCTLFFKYYNNRGWLEFHSYDDPGHVYHAKVLDGQMSGWVCDNILSGATMLADATLIFPYGFDDRKLEVTPREIAFHLPSGGFAGGMGYFNNTGARVAEIGYANVGGGYYYIGEAYDNPNGKLKIGSLEAKGAITAPTFNGNATSATSAEAAETAKMLSGWPDNRNTNTKPNDYNNKFLPVGIKQNATIGITDGGLYSAIFGMRGWGDTSGGKAHEIAFTANGKIYHRAGDTDTWEPWREIAHVDNLGTGGASDGNDNHTHDIYIPISGSLPQPFVHWYINDPDDGTAAYECQPDGADCIHRWSLGNAYIEYVKTALQPNSSAVSLGASHYKWNTVYAATGTIQTSDRNQKNSIEALSDEKARAFILGLKPSAYKMNDGTSGRTHWGLISQDIEELLARLGIDSMDFAGFIKSPKVIVHDTDAAGNHLKKPVIEVIEGEYDYSLRYDEFIAPIIKVIQMQQAEIESLKADKAQLEARLAKIEERLEI